MVRLFKNKLSTGILTFFVVMLAFYSIAAAATVDVNTFSLRAVIPDNQVDKKQTYFDLRLSPGEEQTIQVIVANSEDYPINAYINVNTATTGANGIILYNEENVQDLSRIAAMEEIAEVLQPQITIPANGTATANIRLRMPDFAFDGHLLGGIVVSADAEEEAGIVVGEGIQINNKFLYVLGLKLSVTDAVVEPELNLVSVAPVIDNHRSVLEINVQNSEPVIIKGMDVNAQVYRNGSAEAHRELILTDVEMAPNSTGAFIVNWDNKAIEQGNYRLKLQISHNGRLWEWDESFTVNGDTAKEMKDNSIVEVSPSYGSYFILGILVLIILLSLVFWLGRRSIAKRA